MKTDKFIGYLEEPEKLDVVNLEELRGVLQEYPYFQTAHVLLLKALNNIQDMKFNNQLKVSAAHIGNRRILFNLIHRDKFTARIDIKEKHKDVEASLSDESEPEESLADKILKEIEQLKKPEKDSGGDVFLIDEKADVQEQESESFPLESESDLISKEDSDLLELDKSDSASDIEKKNLKSQKHSENEAHSFSEWLDIFHSAYATTYHEGGIKLADENSKLDLIDRFLKEKPRIEPRSPLEETKPPLDMSDGSTRENEEFFTETLAKIYIQQKHYKKAIYAYEKLSLKYPEKYIYFAHQIDEIKRFINQ